MSFYRHKIFNISKLKNRLQKIKNSELKPDFCQNYTVSFAPKNPLIFFLLTVSGGTTCQHSKICSLVPSVLGFRQPRSIFPMRQPVREWNFRTRNLSIFFPFSKISFDIGVDASRLRSSTTVQKEKKKIILIKVPKILRGIFWKIHSKFPLIMYRKVWHKLVN